MKERDRHSQGEAADSDLESSLDPGKQSLTDQIGKSQRAISSVPGRSMRSDAIGVQHKAQGATHGEQAIARSGGGAAPSAVPSAVTSALSQAQGSPLPDSERWSSRVGADVSNAQIVTGSAAAAAAASINARAFTVGNRVFFGAGADASTDGGGLLAHELTHVAQQRGAAAPQSWDQLPILEHGDHREVAARANDGATSTTGEVAIARDAPPELSGKAYRDKYADKIGDGIDGFLMGSTLEVGSRFIHVLGPPTLPLMILAGSKGADLNTKLDTWLNGAAIQTAIENSRAHGRILVKTSDDDPGTTQDATTGPDRWFPDVAVDLANKLLAEMRKSLARLVPRYIDAAIALGVAEEEKQKANLITPPRVTAKDVVTSAPMDVPVLAALVGGTFDYADYRKANPTEKGKLGVVQTLNLSWEAPRAGTYWVRATVKDDPKAVATVEDVSMMLFGTTNSSGKFAVAAPPLFGFRGGSELKPEWQKKLKDMGVVNLDEYHGPDDVEAQAAAPGPLHDELSKLQGAGVATKALTKMDIVRLLDDSMRTLITIDKNGAVYGMGKDPSMPGTEALKKALTDRHAKILAGSDEEAAGWAGQAQGQSDVLTEVSFAMEKHAKRHADMTKFETDAAKKAGGFNLPGFVREALHRVAAGFANAVKMSDLPATASAILAKAEDDAGQLPIEFAEGMLAAIQRGIDDVRDNKKKEGGDHDSYGVDAMREREEKLKVRLARLRELLQTNPQQAETELGEIQKELSALATETELVGNMDQIDTAWQAMDSSLSFWWSSMGTRMNIRGLQIQGNGYHARWKAIFTSYKNGDAKAKEKAKTDIEALRNDEGLKKWFGAVKSAVKSAQIEAMIGKLVALVAITILTDGLGDIVFAGAEGWGLSTGAAAVVTGGAEALAFTTLNQIFIDDDHGLGHIAFDFAANWLMFGAMRRFAAFAKAAELAKVGTVTGQVILMAGMTFGRAEIEKLYKDGRHLNKEEIAQIAVQGILMAIAMHAISPKVKPLFSDLENSSYSFATKLRANNAARVALEGRVEGLKTGKDLKLGQDFIAGEKKFVEERLAVLDEITKQAEAEAKKNPNAKDSLPARLKMTPAEIKDMQGALKDALATLNNEAILANLSPKGPGQYSCPAEHFDPTVKALGDIQSTKTVDGARTVEVKTKDGQTVTVTEVPDAAAEWLATLRSKLQPDQIARLEKLSKNRTPREVFNTLKGDADYALEVLSKDGPRGKDTGDLFGVGKAPDGEARWSYFADEANWSPDRRALHETLLKEAEAEAMKFAEAMSGSGRGPAIYAMRGNTAVGKSRTAKGKIPELKPGLDATGDQRSVNPDNFKQRLMTDGGQSLTSDQVHMESSLLATRLQTRLSTAKTADGKAASIMIDKRLAKGTDVEAYVQMAKDTGRQLVLYDVDAPLENSLAGVLERQPGGDSPLPPFDVVGDGFNAVRQNRLAVIDIFVKDPTLGEYTLYATKPDGSQVEVVSVKGGKMSDPADPALFKELTAPPGDAASLTANKMITEKFIQDVTANLPADRAIHVRTILRKYIGKTWKQALDGHALETPPKKP